MWRHLAYSDGVCAISAGRSVWRAATLPFGFFRGRIPDASDWARDDETSWPSVATVERLFGSLPQALVAADVYRRPQR